MDDINFRKETKRLLFEFVDFCKKNDIWYSLANESLLGIVRHGGFIPWQIKANVYMTPESYEKLRRRLENSYFKKNEENLGKLFDNFNDKNYKIFQPSYQTFKKNINDIEPHIKIFIIVPSTKNKIKKRKILFNSSLYQRNKNYIDIVEKIKEKKDPEGWAVISNKGKKMKLFWLGFINTDLINLNFGEKKMSVIKSYDDLLIKMYGEKYMEISEIPNKYKIVLNVYKERKNKGE